MKEYKSKDFFRREPQHDTLMWVSKDLRFTITTTTNQYSKYFVYINLGTADEWVGISVGSLDEAIEELNKMINSGEMERFEF